MRPVSAVDQNGLWKNISVHYHSFISQQENNLAPGVISDFSEAMAVFRSRLDNNDNYRKMPIWPLLDQFCCEQLWYLLLETYLVQSYKLIKM